MHPIKPELDGTDLSENKDPRGTYFFREYANICREKERGVHPLSLAQVASKRVRGESHVA